MSMASKRSIALDVVRCVALFSVNAVHFFLNNGFYKQTMTGGRMLVMMVMRNSFMVCVPLFILLTGYLMGNKKLSRGYYLRVVRVVSIYALASLFCAAYKIHVRKTGLTIAGAFWGILSFNAAPYAWYMEMYLGLFLLVPFLNILYHGLERRGHKRWLLATLLVLTAAPSMLNIFRVAGLDWWLSPNTSQEYQQLIPQWWTDLYPITYYYLGCYLKEYPLRLKPVKHLLLLAGSTLAFGLFSFYRCRNGLFIWGDWQSWGSAFVTLQTVLVFTFLVQRSYRWVPKPVQGVITKVSEWSLGAYLVSWVFDKLVYAWLNAAVPDTLDRLPWFVVAVPVVFACSVAVSGVLELIHNVTVEPVMNRLTGKKG